MHGQKDITKKIFSMCVCGSGPKVSRRRTDIQLKPKVLFDVPKIRVPIRVPFFTFFWTVHRDILA